MERGKTWHKFIVTADIFVLNRFSSVNKNFTEKLSAQVVDVEARFLHHNYCCIESFPEFPGVVFHIA